MHARAYSVSRGRAHSSGPLSTNSVGAENSTDSGADTPAGKPAGKTSVRFASADGNGLNASDVAAIRRAVEEAATSRSKAGSFPRSFGNRLAEDGRMVSGWGEGWVEVWFVGGGGGGEGGGGVGSGLEGIATNHLPATTHHPPLTHNPRLTHA